MLPLISSSLPCNIFTATVTCKPWAVSPCVVRGNVSLNFNIVRVTVACITLPNAPAPSSGPNCKAIRRLHNPIVYQWKLSNQSIDDTSSMPLYIFGNCYTYRRR